MIKDAFSIVRKNINCRLVIIGEGKENVSLKNLCKTLGIEKYVSFPGSKDNIFSFLF